jgi:hypothetical protein
MVSAMARGPRHVNRTGSHANTSRLCNEDLASTKKVACITFDILMPPTYRYRVQELLGHINIATTVRYTHVVVKPGVNIQSPIDRLKL